MALRQRFARIALDCGGLIGLATLVLYVWIAPTHIVDGDNQDVVLVTWSMMSLQWYRDRVARRGIVAPAGDEPPLVRLADFLLASGKSLYVDRSQTAILAAFQRIRSAS